jgi:hypothetical protein
MAPLAGSEPDRRPVPREALAPDGVVSEARLCQSSIVSNAGLSRVKFSHKQGPPDAYSGGPLLCEGSGRDRSFTNDSTGAPGDLAGATRKVHPGVARARAYSRVVAQSAGP